MYTVPSDPMTGDDCVGMPCRSAWQRVAPVLGFSLSRWPPSLATKMKPPKPIAGDVLTCEPVLAVRHF
jgi:hypothetical protein